MILQGSHELELKINGEGDNRKFLNYWDSVHGQDVCCEIKDGKLYRFVHLPMEVEADQVEDEPKIEDVFQQEEITFAQFLELVEKSILGI